MAHCSPPIRFTSLIIVMIACFFLSQPLEAIAAPELTEDDVLDQNAYLMLSAREYGKLEAKYKSYLDGYANKRMAAETLSAKFAIFSKSPGLESRFDEWVDAYPKSYTARLARGISRVTFAWENRGAKFANATTDWQSQQFSEKLKESISDLLLSLELYSRPVESYRYLIKISKGLDLGIAGPWN